MPAQGAGKSLSTRWIRFDQSGMAQAWKTAPAFATFDIVGDEAMRHVAAGQAQAHLLDEIGMGQIDITRRTQLFRQPIDQLGRSHGAVGGFTDAGYEH